jgi:hypothetical protein
MCAPRYNKFGERIPPGFSPAATSRGSGEGKEEGGGRRIFYKAKAMPRPTREGKALTEAQTANVVEVLIFREMHGSGGTFSWGRDVNDDEQTARKRSESLRIWIQILLFVK